MRNSFSMSTASVMISVSLLVSRGCSSSLQQRQATFLHTAANTPALSQIGGQPERCLEVVGSVWEITWQDECSTIKRAHISIPA